MENTHRKKLGINCRRKDGLMMVGIHLDTFIEAVSKELSSEGWVNFMIVPRDEPHEKYSHFPVIVKDR